MQASQATAGRGASGVSGSRRGVRVVSSRLLHRL